jgi:glycosyltransferase involved in cell wall biosynthesis
MVGIPAYNEERTIAAVVDSASTHVDDVLVVDDGSDDETGERARRAGATVIVHEHNQGYGATLRTIFHRAHAANVDQLVILDGDGQHDAADIPKLVAAQQSTRAELVIGSRFAGGSNTGIPAYRRFGLAV